MKDLKDQRKDNAPLINEKIRAATMQVITLDGANLGVKSRYEALRMAEEASLDLVLLSETGSMGVPVVKIMDFGKELYERKKKKTEAKKHQRVIEVKEIKIRPKIGEHDYQTKMKQATQFLEDGKRVKITLCFRGRENVSKEERGSEIFQRVEQTFHDLGFAKSLAHEGDSRMGQAWSRVYFLKSSK